MIEAIANTRQNTPSQQPATQFNSIQFNSIQFNSIQFNSIQFNSIQFYLKTNLVNYTHVFLSVGQVYHFK
ncbi:MAG: hypothetical protein FWD26_07130 [Treponema sp.]|nr:hypothetical protein [Treponema sp.]